MEWLVLQVINLLTKEFTSAWGKTVPLKKEIPCRGRYSARSPREDIASNIDGFLRPGCLFSEGKEEQTIPLRNQ